MQKRQEEERNEKSYRIMEFGLVIALFLSIAMAIHRVNMYKGRGSGKFNEEEENAYVEALQNKVTRLSEVDCKKLTLDELD